MFLMILVDALSSEYMTEENLPFLYRWKDQCSYVKAIHASCGYCERSEVFTGMYPNTSGNFTAIGYNDKPSEYNNKIILKGMETLEKLSKKNTRRLFNIYSKLTKKQMLGYYIPFQILSRFHLTEDEMEHSENDAFKGESVFSLMNKNSMRYTLDVFTSLGHGVAISDEERIERAKKLIREDYDFIPLYIGSIDAMGHRYAGNDEKMKKYLLIVDSLIQGLIKECNATDKDINIMVLGDHGMEIVEETVDFADAVKDISLELYEDYFYFLDSTIARVWCKDQYKEQIEEHVNKKLHGKGFWIDDKLAARYHIPFGKDRTYGDLIWCTETGKLLFPDFFNRNIDKGMHGYAKPSERGKGLCIFTNRKTVITEGNLVDVCPTICDFLGLHKPNFCEGISFIGERER